MVRMVLAATYMSKLPDGNEPRTGSLDGLIATAPTDPVESIERR
jgi:hypothetical protein